MQPDRATASGRHRRLRPLPRAFYTRHDVLQISRDLIGKQLCTRIDGALTTGIIVETEAYAGPEDRASHAWNGRRTRRTETMYAQGGTAYVYLCYGMHALFNVVTHERGVPHAILIRAIQPVTGISTMLKRRGRPRLDPRLTAGPGVLAQALGIRVAHSGTDLTGRSIWITEGPHPVSPDQIRASERIGVAYAGEHARRPWRFCLKDCPWISRPHPPNGPT